MPRSANSPGTSAASRGDPVTDLPHPAYKPTHSCDLVKEGPGLTCPAGLPVPRGTVLTRSALRSVGVLLVLGLMVMGLSLFWTAHEVRVNNQRACAIVVADAMIPLPAATGQSRAWEAAFEALARERARQLGCDGA